MSDWITKAVFLFYATTLLSLGIIMQYLGAGTLLFSLLFYVLGSSCLWLAINSRRFSVRASPKTDQP